MKKYLFMLISFGITLGWLAPVFAQESAVTAQARLDRVQITVGDLVTYELRVSSSPDQALEIPPQPKANLGEWEVRSCSDLASTPTEDGRIIQGWSCQLTIWDTGYHALPTQIVRFTNADGTQGRATTQPVSIEVASVLDENPADIKPLKPQLMMNEQANYLLMMGISLLSIVVLGFIVWAYFYYQRHRPIPAPVAAPTRPTRDPVVVALEQLDRIAAMNLVAQNRIVDHYSMISDVLRQFIADRWSIPALERTTGEVHMHMSHPGMLRRRDLLLSLLAQSDGVKFARRLPTQNEAYDLLENARQAILGAN